MSVTVSMSMTKAQQGAMYMQNMRLKDKVAELTRRLEAAELNAARYEFLKARDLESIHLGGVFAGLTPENIVLNGLDLDAAIDERLAQGESK